MISPNQKELRKIDKKIRFQKKKEGSWDIEKINELEKKRKLIIKKINIVRKKKEEKIMKEEMREDDWISHFREDNKHDPEPEIDHTIPNTPETRRLRKKVIQKLNDHILSENMNYQINMRMSILRSIKEQMEEDKHMHMGL